MYITINRKWLFKNLEKFEKDNRESLGEEGRILISTKDEGKLEKIADNEYSITESNDNLFVSLETKLDIDTLLDAMEYWKTKLEQIRNIIKN